MRTYLAAAGLLCLLSSNIAAWADASIPEDVFGLMATEPCWLPRASLIAANVDHENNLRILPIVGAGGVQGLHDLANLRSVDAAILSSDSLVYAARQNLLDAQDEKFSYIAKIGTLKLVLIAKNDIKNITALAGKRIATGPAQSAAFASGELIFNALQIPFTRVAKQGESAIEALQSSKADAALILGTEISTASLSNGDFHILALPLPPQLSEIYQPAMLNAQDLAGLNGKNEAVETLSSALVLALFDRPRDAAHVQALKNFEKLMFTFSQDESADNLAANVLGWKRHITAQQILNQARNSNADTAQIIPTGAEP